MLSVRAAKKQFGDTRALDGAGFDLQPGEWLGLLGPNGAGKTTLVRAIAGRVRLDAGEISLQGSVVGPQDREARRQLGVIPQDLAVYPMLTARENLEVFGSLHGVPAGQLKKRTQWALAWTGLEERASDRAGTFSGGMKRRLNIACGILHEPRVILLDEPTVGVDPQSRERIWEMLAELKQRGASLVLTTHQLDEAQEVTDRIVIVDHGKTIAAGTFPELVEQTIGSGHLVTAQLENEPSTSLTQTGFRLEGNSASKTLVDLASELPQMLAALESSGARIVDVHVRAPGLQAVFIHLTGRELRE